MMDKMQPSSRFIKVRGSAFFAKEKNWPPYIRVKECVRVMRKSLKNEIFFQEVSEVSEIDIKL